MTDRPTLRDPLRALRDAIEDSRRTAIRNTILPQNEPWLDRHYIPDFAEPLDGEGE